MNDIATERLLLRPARIDDCFELYDILSQPETTWWADLPLYDNYCEVIDFIMWGNHSLGFWQYMITDKKTDHILGLLQVMGPLFSGDEPGVIRMGYLLSEEERGKGYMTEAVNAVILDISLNVITALPSFVVTLSVSPYAVPFSLVAYALV